MLTATYTLVALSIEHANVRSNLQALQKLLHSSFVDQANLSPAQVGHAVDAVKRLYENYHWRKIDMFLVPALRNAAASAVPIVQQHLQSAQNLQTMPMMQQQPMQGMQPSGDGVSFNNTLSTIWACIAPSVATAGPITPAVLQFPDAIGS